MGKVISFSKPIGAEEPKSHLPEKKESFKNSSDNKLWKIFTEESTFIKTIRLWPCFSKLSPRTNSNELLQKYCENALSESQECVIDFLLHIHDPSFVFDLGFSLKNWSKKDRSFFLYFLKKNF